MGAPDGVSRDAEKRSVFRNRSEPRRFPADCTREKKESVVFFKIIKHETTTREEKENSPDPTRPPQTLTLTSASAGEFLMAADHLFSRMRMDGCQVPVARQQSAPADQTTNNSSGCFS